MRAVVIVVEPPRFDDGLSLDKRRELVDVQTFISQAAVKRFNEGVFHGFAWPNEVEFHPAPIGPIFKRS